MVNNMKKRNILWICVAVGLIVFFLLMLISDVIATGEKIRQINVYLEYAFYLLF